MGAAHHGGGVPSADSDPTSQRPCPAQRHRAQGVGEVGHRGDPLQHQPGVGVASGLPRDVRRDHGLLPVRVVHAVAVDGQPPPRVLRHDLPAQRLQQAALPRRRPGAPGQPWAVEPRGQHALLLVGRERHRTLHRPAPLLGQPGSGRLHQGGRHRRIVDDRPEPAAPGSPTRRRCSSRSRCCAATSAATAPSPSRRPGSTRPTCRPTRCSPSPAPAPRPAATRRCSPSASGPSCATRRRRVARRARLRLHRRLPGRHVPARARRDRPAPPRQRRRAVRRRAGRPAGGGPVPGDDDRVAAGRPRLPPRRARQGPPRAWPPSRRPASWPSRSPPGSSSASARTGRPHRRARGHRRLAPRHGHVQEVIVQNFLPKPGTAMHTRPPCPPTTTSRPSPWPG
jgi:hypothetical protein